MDQDLHGNRHPYLLYGHSFADLAKQRAMNSLELPPRSVERVVLESSFWTIMATAGFLGNILVCIAFYRNPVLRKITPIYIVALAITDILNFLTNGWYICRSHPDHRRLAIWRRWLLCWRVFLNFPCVRLH